MNLQRHVTGPGRRAPAGSWYPMGDAHAIVMCGRGHALALVDNHRIQRGGMVRPSVACPLPGCGWHVFARLEGWPT